MYKNTANEISTQIDWHNYQRANWREVETKGDTLTLHFANAGGAGAHTHNSRKLVRILLLYHLMAMLLIPITQVAFYCAK